MYYDHVYKIFVEMLKIIHAIVRSRWKSCIFEPFNNYTSWSVTKGGRGNSFLVITVCDMFV